MAAVVRVIGQRRVTLGRCVCRDSAVRVLSSVCVWVRFDSLWEKTSNGNVVLAPRSDANTHGWPTPACSHQQIFPQTSGRFPPRCSNAFSRKPPSVRLGGSLKGRHRRKEWGLRAEGDGKNQFTVSDVKTLLFVLDALEDAVCSGRDLIESLEPKDVKEADLPEGWAKFLKKPAKDFKMFCPRALEKIREAKAKIVAGETVDFDQLAADLQMAVPFDATWSTWLRACGYAFNIFAIGWVFSLLDIDGWARWNLPNGGLLTWLEWTAPHVLFSLLFWQNFLSDKIPSLKAYKLAQANTQVEEMSLPFVLGASSFDLAVEAFFLSFKLVFRDQGLYLNCLSSGFAVQPPDTGTQGALGGLAVQKTLPKVFRAPLEIGSMGLLTSVGAIFSDPTISPFSIQSSVSTGDEAATISAPTPLRQSKSVDELTLLTSSEITKYRTWITAALFFAQGIYLTSETISTNSLIAPIATNAVSMFIFLKAVQEIEINPFIPKFREMK